ncbi:MAG: hypothetical protein H7Y43_11010 [Akkermansiaceae bacterium]|nr:hypothetical protein [Verrucomicrobiales bacterium]
MALKTTRVEKMLHASFLQTELEFLKSTPRFQDALPLVTNAEQYQRLCELGEGLLGAHERAHASARQFRQSARRSC